MLTLFWLNAPTVSSDVLCCVSPPPMQFYAHSYMCIDCTWTISYGPIHPKILELTVSRRSLGYTSIIWYSFNQARIAKFSKLLSYIYIHLYTTVAEKSVANRRINRNSCLASSKLTSSSDSSSTRTSGVWLVKKSCIIKSTASCLSVYCCCWYYYRHLLRVNTCFGGYRRRAHATIIIRKRVCQRWWWWWWRRWRRKLFATMISYHYHMMHNNNNLN